MLLAFATTLIEMLRIFPLLLIGYGANKLIIPVFVLALAWFAGVSKEIAILIALCYAGPSGMNVVVFPASYGQDCKTGVSMVLLSSLGAIITVPAIYAAVQLLF